MDTIKVMPNQSMLDVILQGSGSLEAGMQFCFDNGVSISDVPDVGTFYQVSDTALALADSTGTSQRIYWAQNGIVIGTLAKVIVVPVENLITESGGQNLMDEAGNILIQD